MLKKKLDCPECNASLKLNNNKLEKFELSSVVDDEQITNLRSKLTYSENRVSELFNKIKAIDKLNNDSKSKYESDVLKQYNNKLKYDMLLQVYNRDESIRVNRLNEINNEILLIHNQLTQFDKVTCIKYKNMKARSNNEIDKIRFKIQALKSLELVEQPKVSSSKLKLIQNNFETYNRYLKLKEEIDSINISYVDENKIKLNEDLINQYVINTQYNESVIKMREEIQQQIDSIELQSIDRSLEEIKYEIDKINTILSDFHTQYEYYKIIKYYNQYKEYLSDFSQHINDIQEIKQIAIETQCSTLESVVSIINSNLNNISNSLFENECIVNLSLHKMTKATKTVKPNVNFSITYKGIKYEQLNYMSGGEVDRVSLAIIMGFNTLSSFPLILLDENLAHLDCDTTDNAVKVIKKNTNKSVIIVAHDSVEGNYDNVVEL